MHTASDPSSDWTDALHPDTRAQLADVIALRADLSAAWSAANPGIHLDAIPHKEFLRAIKCEIEPSIFSRLIGRKGYPARTAARHIAELHAAAVQYRRARAIRRPLRPIHPQRWYDQIKAAVTLAESKEVNGEQERGVVLLAPTGGGKTTLAFHLMEELKTCVLIPAHESWRRSYYSVLASILRALGQHVPRSAPLAEAALLDHLRSNKVTLLFDEQDFFGRAACNLMRSILNETSASIVLLMVPESWDRLLRDGSEYAAQLTRRCQHIMKTPPCTAETARPFLREFWPDASWNQLAPVAEVLAEAATSFGSLSLLSTVSLDLAGLTGVIPPTAAEAAAVCALYARRHQPAFIIPAA